MARDRHGGYCKNFVDAALGQFLSLRQSQRYQSNLSQRQLWSGVRVPDLVILQKVGILQWVAEIVWRRTVGFAASDARQWAVSWREAHCWVQDGFCWA